MKRLSLRSVTLITLFVLLVGCRTDGTQRPGTMETTTITLVGSASFQQVYENLVQQFQEEYPNIQVQYVLLTGQQANLSLREQAALADVLLLEGMSPPLETALAFLNLDPLMAADPTFDGSDFWPGIMEACQAAGVQVGLPFRANASLIFFDKAAFDAAGLPYHEPGWKWEDFRQAAQTLAIREGEETARYGFSDSGNPLGLLAPLVDNIIAQSGDTLDGRRIAAELEWYVTLANENVILSESGTLPHERQAAMWVSSQFGLTAASATLGDNLGVVAFPAATGVGQSNPVTAGCALISAGTNRSQEAWTFLHYLSRQDLSATGVYPAAPARPSVAQSSDYWAQMEPATVRAVQAALEHGWYRRAEMPELAAVGEALAQALSGERSLAESLPGTLEIRPTVPPPPPDAAIAVATPIATPTRLDSNEDVLIVEYYGAHNHGSEEALAALAQAFNETQDAFDVRIISRPSQGFLPAVELAEIVDCFAWGGYADVFPRIHGEAFREAFYSLSPLMDGEDSSFRDDFEPTALERNRMDGEQFGLPGDMLPNVVYYNATLLARLGLEPPGPGWDVYDFWALAEAATRTEDDPLIYGFVPYNLWPDNLLLFVPEADYFYDRNTSPAAAAFTEPAVTNALTWLGRMAETGVMFPSSWRSSRSTSDSDDAKKLEQSSLIVRGQAAMWIDLAGSRSYPFNTGVAPYPQTHLTQIAGQSPLPSFLVISKRAADPTGCWEWFKFLTSRHNAFPGVPLRRSVMESPEWVAAVGGEDNAAAYRIMISRPRIPSPEPLRASPYSRWWSDALAAVFSGDSPAAVLEAMQRRADAFRICFEAVPPEERNDASASACARQVDPDFQW
jgi:ABC-type glycerol-3-phosphate transport system substrate-binding protein